MVIRTRPLARCHQVVQTRVQLASFSFRGTELVQAVGDIQHLATRWLTNRLNSSSLSIVIAVRMAMDFNSNNNRRPIAAYLQVDHSSQVEKAVLRSIIR